MKTTKFVLEVPNDLITVTGEILSGEYVGAKAEHTLKEAVQTVENYLKAKGIINDFIDKVKSMSRTTADNHMAYFPHGNSIDREE